MDSSHVISASPEYLSFRSNIPCRKIAVEDDSEKVLFLEHLFSLLSIQIWRCLFQVWIVYDGGPKSVKCPLICLPPVSGTADIFFKQIMSLGAKGYRVISVSYPIYWNVNEWCEGFRKLLDFLQLDKVHLFGASLGMS